MTRKEFSGADCQTDSQVKTKVVCASEAFVSDQLTRNCWRFCILIGSSNGDSNKSLSIGHTPSREIQVSVLPSFHFLHNKVIVSQMSDNFQAE